MYKEYEVGCELSKKAIKRWSVPRPIIVSSAFQPTFLATQISCEECSSGKNLKLPKSKAAAAQTYHVRNAIWEDVECKAGPSSTTTTLRRSKDQNSNENFFLAADHHHHLFLTSPQLLDDIASSWSTPHYIAIEKCLLPSVTFPIIFKLNISSSCCCLGSTILTAYLLQPAAAFDYVGILGKCTMLSSLAAYCLKAGMYSIIPAPLMIRS